MLYSLICIDNPNRAQLRIDNRDAHVAFLNSLGTAIKFGGPMFDDAGTGMIGSLVVFEAESLDAARTTMASDPFATSGLFARVDIRPWKWTIGTPGDLRPERRN